MDTLNFAKRYKDEEDDFDKFHDDILLRILSCMSIREQARTSVLSKRWRYLWMSSLNLDFDAPIIRTKMTKVKKLARIIQSEKNVEWVNNVLRLHHGSTIRKFRICFDLVASHKSDRDEWVKYITEKSVQELEVENTTSYCSIAHCGHCTLRFDFVKRLTSLTSLDLTQIRISGELLESILCQCLLLERVSVVGSQDLLSLTVARTVVKLKYLEIRCCHIKKLSIYAANLVSFIFDAPHIDVTYHNCTSLVSLSLKQILSPALIRGALHTLLCLSSQLQKLSIYYGPASTGIISLPVFQNLKHLQLKVDPVSGNLDLVICFIQACPLLVDLKLEIYWGMSSYSAQLGEKVAKNYHHALEVVEYAGFNGIGVEMEFVDYLIKHGLALQKLILIPCRSWEIGRNNLDPDRQAQIEAGREQAKQLMTQIPTNVNLVIL